MKASFDVGNLQQLPKFCVQPIMTDDFYFQSFVFFAGDDVISGNMGLLDQLLALEWVRDNIQGMDHSHWQPSLMACLCSGIGKSAPSNTSVVTGCGATRGTRGCTK